MNTLLNKINKISDNKYFIAIMIFFLIIPMGVVDIINTYLPTTIIRLLLYFIVLLKYIPYIKENKISKMTIVSVIYCLGRFILTYIKSHDLSSSLLSYSFFTIIILFMFVECSIKHNTKDLIEGILLYCEFAIYVNFLCLLFPKFGSLFDCDFFLEYDNNHFIYFILGITVAYLNYYLNKDKASKIRLILLTFISYITTFVCFSATGVIALTILPLALLLSFKFEFLNIISYIGVYLVSFVGVVLCSVQHLFSFLIVDILHKDITLSGRETIWNDFKVEILNSPLIGHGYQSNKIYTIGSYLYAHNHILDELYCGGLVMYLIYSFFVLLPAKKLLENRNTQIAKVLSVIILSIFVDSICESLSIVVFTLIYCLIYYIDVYIKEAN